MALNSALTYVPGERVVFLNIALSFGTIQMLTFTVMTRSTSYESLDGWWRSTFDLANQVTSAPIYTSSSDCLLGHATSFTEKLGFAFAFPALMFFGPSLWDLLFKRAAFFGRAVVRAVVCGNVFLPQVVGTIATLWPCVQLTNQHSLIAAWEVSANGECHPPGTVAIALVGILCCFLVGPILWLALLKTRVECESVPGSLRTPLEFLSDKYKEHC